MFFTVDLNILSLPTLSKISKLGSFFVIQDFLSYNITLTFYQYENIVVANGVKQKLVANDTDKGDNMFCWWEYNPLY